MTVYIVKHQDIEVARRKSDRTYTHAVVVRSSYENHLATAQALHGTDAANYSYFVREASATVEQFLSRTPWHSEAQAAHAIADAQEQIKGITTLDEYRAAKRAERIATVEAEKIAGRFDTFGVIGFCGRRELAESLAAQNRGKAWWAEVLIVEVEAHEKAPKAKRAA